MLIYKNLYIVQFAIKQPGSLYPEYKLFMIYTLNNKDKQEIKNILRNELEVIMKKYKKNIDIIFKYRNIITDLKNRLRKKNIYFEEIEDKIINGQELFNAGG